MTKRIEKAIDIFLDAINQGTLAKGTCTACAVGNLVADGLRATIINEKNIFYCTEDNTKWSSIFMTNDSFQYKLTRYLKEEGPKRNIEATDFTWKELAEIEYAFETNTSISYSDYFIVSAEDIRADQIKGLEAVVKVMLAFDECQDNIKEIFTHKADLIAIN